MTHVLACLDGSTYGDSVCDYAAWLAGRLETEVRLLHVADPGEAASLGRPALQAGRERLAEHGVAVARADERPGSFASSCATFVAASDTDIVVLGKRGLGSEAASRRLGGSVAPLVEATDRPIFLASRTFLPVTRAVALLDAAPDHRRTVEFLCGRPGLAELNLVVAVSAGPDEDSAPKVAWARERLSAHGADVFGIETCGVDRSATEVMEARGADLIIVSRAVLAADPARGLDMLETQGLWGWRTPVLVC